MHYAISTKVLGQTHMRYVFKYIKSNFLNFPFFMCFWIFYTHKNKGIKVRSNAKTTKAMHIQRCMMHKCMTIKHLMYEGFYKDKKKLDQGPKESSTIRTFLYPNETIVWNECLMRHETKVGKMRTRDAHTQEGKNIKKKISTTFHFPPNLVLLSLHNS